MLITQLKAAAEPTRLRVLSLLSKSQLSVNEITQVIGQSQPTVSRHLKSLADAGLIERSPEGAWVFYRVPDDGPGAVLVNKLVSELSSTDPTIAADDAALDNIRLARTEAAARYFSDNAAQWQKLRSLHAANADVEAAMIEIAGSEPIGELLDLGTGTGRILELMAPMIDRGVGLDISHEMLSIARANLTRSGLIRCSVRHGSLYQPPFGDDSFDFIVMHQVLHYLENPAEAIAHAARLLEPGGRLMIADFAPHQLEYLREEHQHRKLGISSDELKTWADNALLSIEQERTLPGPLTSEASLTTKVWLLRNGHSRSPDRLSLVR